VTKSWEEEEQDGSGGVTKSWKEEEDEVVRKSWEGGRGR
jgi:hypothetical protein